VKPVLEKRCFGCHAGGGVAAEEHDLSDAKRLRAERGALLDEVASCSMPPRAPLAEDDASVLLRWAACGEGTE
jgi:hypothetical protein